MKPHSSLYLVATRAFYVAILLAMVSGVVSGAVPSSATEARYVREIWLDESRQRHVNVRLAIPQSNIPSVGAKGLPVLLFSTPQGFRWGGYWEHYQALSAEMLRRGVITVTLAHYDIAETMGVNERFSDIYPGILTGTRNDPSVDRYEDWLFVMNQLARLNQEKRPGWPQLDLSRLAVGGHSSGTLTALHLSGMPVRTRDGTVFAVHRDPRIKSFVLYSYPLEYSGPTRDDLKKVSGIPGLHVAGSKDHPEYRNTSYRYIGGAPQYWLVAEGDHSVGAFGSEELILRVTGDFIDTYLQGNAESRQRLSSPPSGSRKLGLKLFSTKPPSYWQEPDQRDFVAWARESLPWGQWLHTRSIAYHRQRDTPKK